MFTTPSFNLIVLSDITMDLGLVDVDVEPAEMSAKSANESLADLFGSESESDARNDMELPQTGFMDGFEF